MSKSASRLATEIDISTVCYCIFASASLTLDLGFTTIPFKRCAMAENMQTDQIDYGELRFRKLIEHSYAGVTLLDKNLNVVYRSPSSERITGWNAENMAQHNSVSLTHPEDLPVMAQLLAQAMQQPARPVTGRFRTRHYLGYYIWLDCTLTNLLQEPEISAIVFNFVDVTRQTEMETERQHNEKLISEHAGFVRAVTDNLPAMIAYFSRDLRCLFANKPYRENFGMGNEVVGKLKTDLLGPAEFQAHERHVTAVLKGKRQSFERSLPGPGGTTIYTHTQYLPDGKPGSVKGFYSLIYDVSEIKAAENEVKLQSGRMEQLLDNITDGFIAADAAQCYTYVNKRLSEMVGIPPAEMIGRNIWELFPEAVNSVTYHSIQEVLREKHYICSEDFYAPLGLWQENRIYPAAHGFSMFIQDITDRKKAGEQVRQSNERFALIAKATQDALFEWDLATNAIWWSESHFAMFGFDPGRPVPEQADWIGRLHPDDQALFRGIVGKVRAGDLSQWEEEVAYRQTSGHWGTLLARGFIVADSEQRPVKMLGSFMDITERRNGESQRELLAAVSRPFREENELQLILEHTSRALLDYSGCTSAEIWLLNAEGQQLTITSDLAAEGCASRLKSASKLGKGEDLPGVTWSTQDWQRQQTDEGDLFGIPLLDHENFVGVLLLNFSAQNNATTFRRQLPQSLGRQLGVDIRHQQMAEQLRLLFDRAPDMIGILGTDRCFKKVNPAMSSLLEYSEQELLQVSLDVLVHPDDLVSSRERTKAFLTGGDQTLYFENRFLSKSGKAIWLSWTVTRSAEEGLMFCVGKNISDKKEMEDLLHKANKLARIGSWEVDRVKGAAYWSTITREIYEVPETFVPSIDNWLSFYREGADRDYIAGKMADTIATGEPCDAEVELVTALGNIRWVRAMADSEFKDGVCVRVYGSFQDIDNRKKAELAAVAALGERDVILESIGDGFFAVDRDWVITYWNATAEKTLGIARSAVLGKLIWELYGDAKELEFYRQYHQAMQTGQVVHFEDFYPAMRTWFGVSAYPSAHGLSVFFRDITESKEAASALAESEKRYSDLFHLSPQPMWVYDMSTLRYLDVNLAAIEHYGYSHDEFLSMTIREIRPAEDILLMEKILVEKQDQHTVRLEGVFRHRKKNGEIIKVDIQSNKIMYQGVPCKVVLANDVTERERHIEAIETQNEKLREISWMQSHVIRAPVSRIMGLLPMLSIPSGDTEQRQIHDYLVASANELDGIIRSITDVTSIVRLND
jgi:PAS domain S-box-containing protein